MDLLIGLIIGLLVGWLIEWLIDWRFWQPRNEQLRDALAEAEAQITTLKEARQRDRQMRQELAKPGNQLTDTQSKRRDPHPQRTAQSRAALDDEPEMYQPDTDSPNRLTRTWQNKPQNRPNREPSQQPVRYRADDDVMVWGEN